MNKKQFGNAMKVLTNSGLANTGEFNKDKLYIWYLFFAKFEYEDFIKVILLHISNSKFFPTINELLLTLNKESNLPNKFTIWEEFKSKPIKELHPLIVRAFKLAGINRSYLKDITTDTAQRILRPKVEKIYEELVKAKKDIKQLEQISNVIKQIDVKKLKELPEGVDSKEE